MQKLKQDILVYVCKQNNSMSSRADVIANFNSMSSKVVEFAISTLIDQGQLMQQDTAVSVSPLVYNRVFGLVELIPFNGQILQVAKHVINSPPYGVHQTALIKTTGLDSKQVSRAVSMLVEAGLVYKPNHPPRLFWLSLTQLSQPQMSVLSYYMMRNEEPMTDLQIEDLACKTNQLVNLDRELSHEELKAIADEKIIQALLDAKILKKKGKLTKMIYYRNNDTTEATQKEDDQEADQDGLACSITLPNHIKLTQLDRLAIATKIHGGISANIICSDLGKQDTKFLNQIEPIMKAMYPIESYKQQKSNIGTCWRYSDQLMTENMTSKKPFFFEFVKNVNVAVKTEVNETAKLETFMTETTNLVSNNEESLISKIEMIAKSINDEQKRQRLHLIAQIYTSVPTASFNFVYNYISLQLPRLNNLCKLDRVTINEMLNGLVDAEVLTRHGDIFYLANVNPEEITEVQQAQEDEIDTKYTVSKHEYLEKSYELVKRIVITQKKLLGIMKPGCFTPDTLYSYMTVRDMLELSHSNQFMFTSDVLQLIKNDYIDTDVASLPIYIQKMFISSREYQCSRGTITSRLHKLADLGLFESVTQQASVIEPIRRKLDVLQFTTKINQDLSQILTDRQFDQKLATLFSPSWYELDVDSLRLKFDITPDNGYEKLQLLMYDAFLRAQQLGVKLVNIGNSKSDLSIFNDKKIVEDGYVSEVSVKKLNKRLVREILDICMDDGSKSYCYVVEQIFERSKYTDIGLQQMAGLVIMMVRNQMVPAWPVVLNSVTISSERPQTHLIFYRKVQVSRFVDRLQENVKVQYVKRQFASNQKTKMDVTTAQVVFRAVKFNSAVYKSYKLKIYSMCNVAALQPALKQHPTMKPMLYVKTQVAGRYPAMDQPSYLQFRQTAEVAHSSGEEFGILSAQPGQDVRRLKIRRRPAKIGLKSLQVLDSTRPVVRQEIPTIEQHLELAIASTEYFRNLAKNVNNPPCEYRTYLNQLGLVTTEQPKYEQERAMILKNVQATYSSLVQQQMSFQKDIQTINEVDGFVQSILKQPLTRSSQQATKTRPLDAPEESHSELLSVSLQPKVLQGYDQQFEHSTSQHIQRPLRQTPISAFSPMLQQDDVKPSLNLMQHKAFMPNNTLGWHSEVVNDGRTREAAISLVKKLTECGFVRYDELSFGERQACRFGLFQPLLYTTKYVTLRNQVDFNQLNAENELQELVEVLYKNIVENPKPAVSMSTVETWGISAGPRLVAAAEIDCQVEVRGGWIVK